MAQFVRFDQAPGPVFTRWSGVFKFMNILRSSSAWTGRLFWLVFGVAAMQPMMLRAATEETFDVLQIGAHVYTNVTVTARAKTYVFLMHAGGIINLKVIDLPPDLRTKLGYNAVSQTVSTNSNAAAVWVKQQTAKLQVPQLKEWEQKLGGKGCGSGAGIHLDTKQLYLICGAVAVLFVCFCYCSSLICEKTGQKPGVLIWLPVLQIFPLLRAAGMSYLWFLAYWVPVLNLVAQLVWSVKISRARGKSGWVALWLLLPVTNLFAFLYLAFSKGGDKKEDRQASRSKMTALPGGTQCALGA